MEAIRRKVWKGKILIQVRVSHPESIGSQDYLLVAGRVSYLYSHLPTIISYFRRYLEDSSSGNWWIEFENEPIPPNRPLGLIYDSMVGLPTGEPWQLTLKRGSYPSSKIICFDEMNTLQNYWVNQLKECCYLRTRNAKSVMLLPRKEHEESWSAIQNAGNSDIDNYWQFWKHHSWLIRPSATKNTRFPVPIRMYISRPSKENETRKVKTVVPCPANCSQKLKRCIPEEYHSGYVAIVQGVEVPFSSPIQDLYLGCLYADGFLHVTLVPGKYKGIIGTSYDT